MKFKLIALSIISSLYLTACVQMFPAQALKQSDNGDYVIQTSSNLFGSNRAMLEKVNKKAAATCEGKGFTEVNTNLRHQVEPVYSPYITTSMYKIFYKTIKCNL